MSDQGNFFDKAQFKVVCYILFMTDLCLVCICVVYFNQILGAAGTQKLVEILFWALHIFENKKKAVLGGPFLGIKPSTSVLVQPKNPVFFKILHKICYFYVFFILKAQKTLKTHILTSVWRAQHPNCQKIQHQRVGKEYCPHSSDFIYK